MKIQKVIDLFCSAQINLRFSVSKMPPKGYDEKNIEMRLTCPHAFLREKKGTFIRQTFHFFTEFILSFLIFGQKEPKISVFSFKFFIKRISKNLNFQFVVINCTKKGGGVMGPPKNEKNPFLADFGGAQTSPLNFFSVSEGTFISHTFLIQLITAKKSLEKLFSKW